MLKVPKFESEAQAAQWWFELAAKTGESFEDFVRRVVHQALELEKTA